MNRSGETSWKRVLSKGRVLLGSPRGAGAIAQTAATRFLVAGINVCTGIISARVLGSVGRGEMSAMLVWPGLLAYLLTLGLPAAIRYWIRREPNRRSELFTVSVLGATIASIAAIGIGVTFIPVWLKSYPTTVVHAAQVLMIFSPEVMLGLIFSAMLETLGQFRAANTTRYATAFLTLAALIALAISHQMNPFTGALAYTCAPVVIALVIAWRLRSHFVIRPFDPRPAIRLLGSYGARSYGADLLNTILTQVDQVLVIAFLSASDVGIYVVALNASRVVNIMHSAVVTVVFPTAAGRQQQDVVSMVERSARVSMAISLAFAAAFAITLPLLLPAFYGPAFVRGVAVAQILTLEAVLNGLVYVLAQAFMALDRPGIVTILQGIGLAVVLPLMFYLLPRYGLVGAAIALLSSTICRLLLVVAAYPIVLRERIPQLAFEREDFRQLRSALIGSRF
jgi:O-antigen/teichoic acid export membrane protein